MKHRSTLIGVVAAIAVLLAFTTWALAQVTAPAPAPKVAKPAAKIAPLQRISIPEAALQTVRIGRIRAWAPPSVGQTVRTLMSTTSGEEQAEESGAEGFLSSEQPVGSYATISPNTLSPESSPASGWFFTQVGDVMSREDQVAAGIAVIPLKSLTTYSGFFKVYHTGTEASAYYLITFHLLALPVAGGSGSPREVNLTTYRHTWGPFWTEVSGEGTTLHLSPGADGVYPMVVRIPRGDGFRRAWAVDGHNIAIRGITVDKIG